MKNRFIQYISCSLLFIIGIQHVNAQRGEWVNQVIVVNSGKFEFVPPYLDYVTVQAYDPVTHVVKVFDTIYTQSAQDVVINGHFAYVAAQDSIIKYDLDSYQRVAAIADSGMVKLGIFKNMLIVAKQYPIKRFFVEILDQNLALLALIEGISGDCGGVTADKDSVYVAVNHGWQGTTGRLAVINPSNWTLVREENFGTNAIGIWNLYNYGGKVFSINRTPYGYPPVGSITGYNIYSGSFSTDVLSYTIGDGAGIVDNLLYLKFDEGIGSYNLDTQTVVDPSIVPDPGSINHIYIISSGVDYVNNLLYLNIGNRTANGFGVITTLAGDSVTSFQEGVSAECIAMDYRTPVGIQPVSMEQNQVSVYPNPVNSILTVTIHNNDKVNEISVIDLTGITLIKNSFIGEEKKLKINCGSLSAGIYFLSIKTANGLITRKFIKQ